MKTSATISRGLAGMAARQRIIDRIDSAAFEKQRAFVQDEYRRAFLFCPRRAGKSLGSALKLFRIATKYPGSRGRYIGLTRQTAKDIMWDVLKDVESRLGPPGADGKPTPLGAVFNETELKVTLPNGSSFRLVGMDANAKQLPKVLGGNLKIVIIDEAASYSVDIRALIKDFIGPATLDERGSIVMAGTPDPDEARGYFYDVTTNKESERWSKHTWDTLDNPFMAEQWADELARIQHEDPLYMETPEFRCMFKAEWPDSPSGWVYRFDRTRNLIDRADLPEIHHRVIGLDLGWRDAKAIVDVGWNKHDKRLFILHAEKAAELHLDTFAARVAAVEKMHPVYAHKVIDGANSDVVQEMRKRYGLHAENANKPEKANHIRIMNTEILTGRVQVVRGWTDEHGHARGGTPLIIEWSGADEGGAAVRGASPLIWDKRAMQFRPPVLREDSRCANHASDSALYAFFYAWNYMGRAENKAPLPGTEAWAAAERLRNRAKLNRKLREAAA